MLPISLTLTEQRTARSQRGRSCVFCFFQRFFRERSRDVPGGRLQCRGSPPEGAAPPRDAAAAPHPGALPHPGGSRSNNAPGNPCCCGEFHCPSLELFPADPCSHGEFCAVLTLRGSGKIGGCTGRADTDTFNRHRLLLVCQWMCNQSLNHLKQRMAGERRA